MPIKALIFDFDGLILDTETPHYHAWTSLYQSYGVELRLDRWLLDIGTHGMFDPCADIEELLGRSIDHDLTRAERRAAHIALCEQEELRPGVLSLLEAGKQAGLRMAVASSSNREWLDRWLVHHGILDYFMCIRSRDDVQRVKPDPELFVSAAACLGVAPDECVVFEDSPNGMRAAAAAGIRCVAVPNSMTSQLEIPEVALRLESLADFPLAELIARLENISLSRPV